MSLGLADSHELCNIICSLKNIVKESRVLTEKKIMNSNYKFPGKNQSEVLFNLKKSNYNNNRI